MHGRAFVLGLDIVAPYLGQVHGHGLGDFRGRGDGVAGEKPAAGDDRPLRYREVSGFQKSFHIISPVILIGFIGFFHIYDR